MIKTLRALLGKTPREPPAKKPAPRAGSKPSNNRGEYRAVSLAPSSTCCAATKDALASATCCAKRHAYPWWKPRET
jgi:hypothetical protein